MIAVSAGCTSTALTHSATSNGLHGEVVMSYTGDKSSYNLILVNISDKPIRIPFGANQPSDTPSDSVDISYNITYSNRRTIYSDNQITYLYSEAGDLYPDTPNTMTTSRTHKLFASDKYEFQTITIQPTEKAKFVISGLNFLVESELAEAKRANKLLRDGDISFSFMRKPEDSDTQDLWHGKMDFCVKLETGEQKKNVVSSGFPNLGVKHLLSTVRDNVDGLTGEIILSSMRNGPCFKLILRNTSSDPIKLCFGQNLESPIDHNVNRFWSPNDKYLHLGIKVNNDFYVLGNEGDLFFEKMFGIKIPQHEKDKSNKGWVRDNNLSATNSSAIRHKLTIDNNRPPEIVTLAPRAHLEFPLQHVDDVVARALAKANNAKDIDLREVSIVADIIRKPDNTDAPSVWSGHLQLTLKLPVAIMNNWEQEVLKAQ